MKKSSVRLSFLTSGLGRSMTIALFGFAGTLSAQPYAPSGAAEYVMDNYMPSTWQLSTVTNKIWVAPGGTGDGSSESSPLDSIQDAVNQATAGTVILVKAGTYNEALVLSAFPSIDANTGLPVPAVPTSDGTDTSPILLVSADGLEAATIESPAGLHSTIESWRIQNWGIIGFHVICNNNSGNQDKSPLKIGGVHVIRESDANGNPNPDGGHLETEHLTRNWLIAGNRFSGAGTDGSKSFSSRNIFWIGNTFDGAWAEEGIDAFSVGVVDPDEDRSQIAFNTMQGTANSDAITLKHGSNNFLIYNNLFELITDADQPYSPTKGSGRTLVLGSKVGPNFASFNVPLESEDPEFHPKAANKVEVLYNLFGAHTGKNIQLNGATFCVIRHNELDNPVAVSEIGDGANDVYKDGSYIAEPFGQVIEDNHVFNSAPQNPNFPENVFRYPSKWDDPSKWTNPSVASEMLLYYDHGLYPEVSDGFYTMSGNGPSVLFYYPVGSVYVASAIQSMINSLRDEMNLQLVVNGDFETGDDGNWTHVSTSIQQSTTFNLSDYAGRITPGGYYRKITQDVPVVPGETLNASCYIKIDGFDGVKSAAYQIRFYDADTSSWLTPYVIVANPLSTLNDDWEYFHMEGIVVPPDADIAVVWLASSSTTGSAYYDNVELWSRFAGVEKLHDGNFDSSNSSDDWDLHFSADISPTGGVGGSPALHQTGESGWTINSQEVSLDGVTALNVTGKIKTDSIASISNAVIQVRFFDGATQIHVESVGAQSGTSSGFVLFSYENMSIPSGADTAKVCLAVTGGNQGQAWFDDIQLRAEY